MELNEINYIPVTVALAEIVSKSEYLESRSITNAIWFNI